MKLSLLNSDFRTISQARAEIINDRGLEHWTDMAGFIGNKAPKTPESPVEIDYGDSMQRTGFDILGQLWAEPGKYFMPYNEKFRSRILAHKIGKGLYVRKPGTQFWYSKLNTTTSDQLRPMLIAMGELHMKQELKDVAWALIKRGGFYWNTRDTGQTEQDKPKLPGWSGPEQWNIILRGLLPNKWWSKLLLLPGDIVGLFSTIFATYKTKPGRADQLNRLCTLVQGVRTLPTPVSKLSLEIFRRYRPTWRLFVDASWNRMWRKDKNYNPGLFVLESYFWNRDIDPPFEFGPWRAVCKKYFWREM